MWNDNTLLNGPFEPWHHEEEAFDLEVVGTIPAELNGVLYRGSANPHLRPTRPERHHWFDGDGMIFAIFVRDGKAHCTNRWVQTASFVAESENGAAIYGSYMNGGTPPDPALKPPMKNAANTNVMLFDDRLLVFQETDLPHQLHPTTLETFGQYDFHGKVGGAITAHWKIDPRNHDLLFYGMNGTTITWYHADKHGRLLDSASFDAGHPSIMHDFVATDDYAVFQISPLVLSAENIVAGRPMMVWDPETAPGSRFAVLNRHTQEVKWFEAEGDFIVTHFYNGYQDGDRLVVDGHRSGLWGWTPEMLDTIDQDEEQDFNAPFKSVVAEPWRWEIDMVTGKVTNHQTTDVAGDFPRINDAFMTHEHRYGYFATIQGNDYSLTDGLAKYDYRTDQTQLIPTGDLTSPSEPVFVPRASASTEDDGYLLVLWYNPLTRLTELLIHDAQQFGDEPVARVRLNRRVPPGFHGNWIGSEQLEAALTAAPLVA